MQILSSGKSPNADFMSIGEKVKSARKALGLTLVDLEARTQIANSTISRIENGKTEPERKTLIALGRALNSNFGLDWLDDFLTGEPTPPSKREIAEDLSFEEILSLKFDGGGETRSRAQMRALAQLLDAEIEKEKRIMGYPEYKKKK